MGSWFERRSVRVKIVLLVLTTLLPAAAMLAWLLAVHLREAREAAHAKVEILAVSTRDDVERLLKQAEAVLTRLAERPLVKALDPSRCDTVVTEFVQLYPQFSRLGLLDAQGRIVCAYLPDPQTQSGLESAPWLVEALESGRFFASGAVQQGPTGEWATVLSHPVRNEAGAVVGVLAMSLDLLTLSHQLMAAVPANAVVSVVDRERAMLLRSAAVETFVGKRPAAGDSDPLRGQPEGFQLATGRDGVPRLVAFTTIPGQNWRVAAGLPQAEVFAEYNATLRNTLGLGAAGLLLALALAWRLAVSILRPISGLARTAADVAAGNSLARAPLAGPAEVEAVAQQFNRMLDANSAAEAALRESEARYRTLVDWSPEGISVHRDGKIVYVNRTAVEMLGAKIAEELIGKDSLEFVHPAARERGLQAADQIMRHGQMVPVQAQQFLTLDGRIVDVEVQGLPIVYAGEPAVFASMRDVTARKQTETALRVSEARLHGIIESATDAIITVDEAQTIVMANPAAAAMFGHALGELVGAPLERLIPARFHATHRHDVQEFGRSGAAARHMGSARDVMGVRASGEEFPIDAAISHLMAGGQRLYTVILRDITERRRAEEALRDSEARLHRLLVGLPEAVFVNSGDRISFVNEAAQRLFGADEAALLGRPPLELIHPDSRELVMSRIGTLRGGASVAPLAELKILRADGESRWVESVGTLIDDHNGRSVLVVLRDVTELKQAQAELTRSHFDLQRLIDARERIQEEERKRIARELHDDLQQTLAAIRINAVAIGGRLEADRAKVEPMLAEIDALAQSAVASTRRIVNDLRPQALEDLGLVAALESLLGLFSQRTGIACRLDASETMGDVLMAWPAVSTCLYRVAQEALNNVAKHAQAKAVLVQLAAAVGGQAWLRVSDDGRGMTDAERHKTESFGLLGMHERVRALGGVLQVRSAAGAGTAVEVLVPLRAAPATLRQPAPAQPGPAFEPALPVPEIVQGERDTAHVQAVIDALEEHVAVLDRQGVILLVNRAWCAFAERNGAPEGLTCGPGVNYLDVCRRSAANDSQVVPVLEGLLAVLDGDRPAFVSEYPCHGPDGQRWFRMHVSLMSDGHVLVTHFNLADASSTAAEHTN